MLRREKGFTLIELLIVVAIIGIIAAIAVPNLLAAIQRSKRSRTAADMRAIGTALGSYQVDYNYYPRKSGGTAVQLDKTADDWGIGLPKVFYQGSDADAWTTRFYYYTDATGSGYTLRSYGKDMQEGWKGTTEYGSDILFINGMFKAPAKLVK
jgi:general secretion pathway protein G